jgi:hypothetical protein
MKLKSHLSAKISLLTFVSVFFLLTSLGSGISQATTVCEPEQEIFSITIKNFALDIRRTIGNTVNSFLGDIFQKVTGVAINKLVGCGSYYNANGVIVPDPMRTCSGTPDETCRAMLNNFSSIGTGGPTAFNPQQYREDMSKSGIGGSLFGLILQSGTKLETEAPPVNLAYFWADTVKNVPFVGKAYAADTMQSYGNPILEGVIDLWKFTRNISLSVMAIVMLVTGIMIVMRRNISSQVAVSVQYALPRIVIGFVLIIFSYPIGAFITQLAWVLFMSAPIIVLVQVSNNSVTGFALLMVSIMFNILSNPVGFMSIGILIICLIVAFVQFLIFIIKAFMIYIKMIFSVVTAPVEFALGSIPGSEAKIMDWFKRMAKYTITLFLMNAVAAVVLWMGVQFGSAFNEATYGLGSFVEAMIPGLMLVYGLSLAIGMEKRVDEFIFGPAKGGKK